MCKVKVCAAARPLTDVDEQRGDACHILTRPVCLGNQARHACHILTTGIPDQCVLEAKPRHTAATRRLAFLAACRARRLGASLALNTASSPRSPLQASSLRSPLQASSPHSPLQASSPRIPIQASSPLRPLQASFPRRPLQLSLIHI